MFLRFRFSRRCRSRSISISSSRIFGWILFFDTLFFRKSDDKNMNEEPQISRPNPILMCLHHHHHPHCHCHFHIIECGAARLKVHKQNHKRMRWWWSKLKIMNGTQADNKSYESIWPDTVRQICRMCKLYICSFSSAFISISCTVMLKTANGINSTNVRTNIDDFLSEVKCLQCQRKWHRRIFNRMVLWNQLVVLMCTKRKCMCARCSTDLTQLMQCSHVWRENKALPKVHTIYVHSARMRQQFQLYSKYII